MTCTRGCAAIAIWVFVAQLLSACSTINFLWPAAVPAPPPRPPMVPAPPAAARSFDYSTPDRVRAEIIRWFWRAGYPKIQVEALVDHARNESGFRPCAANGPNLRYTFQWSGARLGRLYQFAGARSRCPPLDKQLAFADYELRSEPNYSCFWRATTRTAALAALRRGFGHGRC